MFHFYKKIKNEIYPILIASILKIDPMDMASLMRQTKKADLLFPKTNLMIWKKQKQLNSQLIKK